MSNRTISDEKEMRQRWDKLIAAMEQESIDCLLMYSTDRLFSGYLRYVTDCPTIMYPLSGLFSKKGISLVGHGVKEIPLYPVPVERLKKGQYQFHAGGVRQHDFIVDQIGVPACPTTTYSVDMWSEAIAEIIRRDKFKRIGIVGMSTIPASIYMYLVKNMPNLEIVDATAMVDEIKSCKSAYEMEQAEKCVWIIDELMAAAPSVMKVRQNIREVGRKIRSLADNYDCMDLNIMIGRHPTMPMFSDWPFTDDEIIQRNDCIELMVEVSSNIGLWGECARVYSMGVPPDDLVKNAQLCFEMQDYAASLIIPGAIPCELFKKYCDRLEANGFPPEKRFFCHGQGYDVVEMPFIRPESEIPLQEGAFIAIHPSLYNASKSVGCFICDNYKVTKNGTIRMNRTPREIIPVCNIDISH